MPAYKDGSSNWTMNRKRWWKWVTENFLSFLEKNYPDGFTKKEVIGPYGKHLKDLGNAVSLTAIKGYIKYFMEIGDIVQVNNHLELAQEKK